MLPITKLLNEMTKPLLLRMARGLELDAFSSDTVATLKQRIKREKPDIDIALATLLRTQLQDLASGFDLDESGTKDELILRLCSEVDPDAFGADDDDDEDDYEDEEDDDYDYEDDDDDDDDPTSSAFDDDFRLRGETPTLRPYQRQAIERLIPRIGETAPQLLHLATGGGKTLVANELASRWRTNEEGPVLWVTKDWPLLYQAAADISSRRTGPKALGRVGGEASALRGLDDWTNSKSFVYTTLHTFKSRRHELRAFKPSLVVWDECHWGENATLGRHLLSWCKRRGVPLLGLSATPREPEKSRFTVAFSRSFAQLVKEGHLARPILVPSVRTGARWSPERHGRGDATAASLNTLARGKARNDKIVDHYARNADKYGSTIVFACNIEHAVALAKAFNARGFAARPVHSGQPREVNSQHVQDLKARKLRILVNVAMLTHGVDIPSVKTVFLARPTFSDILFAQMVGRAARRDEESGKDTFYVVEFDDQLEQHGDQLVTAVKHFEGTGALGNEKSAPVRQRSVRPQAKPGHQFDPHGQPRELPNLQQIHEAMRGLWYRQGQTFGFELELTKRGFTEEMSHAEWRRTATELHRALKTALGSNLVASAPLEWGDTSYERWNVVRDNSCGWEVKTRVLEGEEGMREVVVGVDALREAADGLGLVVNASTGLHLHVGWLGKRRDALARSLRLVRLFEPALATLVAPSRIFAFKSGGYDTTEPNEYCRPVSAVFPDVRLDQVRSSAELSALCSDDDDRYVTFNIRPLENINTVEARLHNGTLEPTKMLLWLSLWQQILWAADLSLEIPTVPDARRILPTGDIVDLVRRYLPGAYSPHFLARLEARRGEIEALYRKAGLPFGA